jgi:hypothetical protein
MTETVRKELLAQLQHLRSEAKEITRLYAANLQRDIVQLIEFLNESQNQTPGGRNPRGSKLLLSRMKETLDAINLKPEKGRRKDLRKIEDAVRSLRKIAFSGRKDV